MPGPLVDEVPLTKLLRLLFPGRFRGYSPHPPVRRRWSLAGPELRPVQSEKGIVDASACTKSRLDTCNLLRSRTRSPQPMDHLVNGTEQPEPAGLCGFRADSARECYRTAATGCSACNATSTVSPGCSSASTSASIFDGWPSTTRMITILGWLSTPRTSCDFTMPV